MDDRGWRMEDRGRGRIEEGGRREDKGTSCVKHDVGLSATSEVDYFYGGRVFRVKTFHQNIRRF
jgi:hypothetical protein